MGEVPHEDELIPLELRYPVGRHRQAVACLQARLLGHMAPFFMVPYALTPPTYNRQAGGLEVVPRHCDMAEAACVCASQTRCMISPVRLASLSKTSKSAHEGEAPRARAPSWPSLGKNR